MKRREATSGGHDRRGAPGETEAGATRSGIPMGAVAKTGCEAKRNSRIKNALDEGERANK